jgi:hypothetical protein
MIGYLEIIKHKSMHGTPTETISIVCSLACFAIKFIERFPNAGKA